MQSKIQTIAKKSNIFIKTKWSFILFLSCIVIFGVVNLILFLKGDISLNSILFQNLNIGHKGALYINDKYGWIGILQSFISTIGSTLTIAGVILTVRLNRKFIKPLLIGEALVILDSIIVGAIFTAISYILMIGSAIYNYIHNWKDEDDAKPISRMTYKLWVGSFIFLLGYISIGILIEMYLFQPSGTLLILNASNDILSSAVVVVSWFIVLNKEKKGFIGFLITDILYLVSFFSLHVYATGASYLVYIFLDAASILSWISLEATKNYH